jgi:hypothetical protein
MPLGGGSTLACHHVLLSCSSKKYGVIHVVLGMFQAARCPWVTQATCGVVFPTLSSQKKNRVPSLSNSSHFKTLARQFCTGVSPNNQCIRVESIVLDTACCAKYPPADNMSLGTGHIVLCDIIAKKKSWKIEVICGLVGNIRGKFVLITAARQAADEMCSLCVNRVCNVQRADGRFSGILTC